MIKLVVFDMAGTTVDEDNVVYKTVQEALNAAGYGFSLPQVLEFGAGKEKSQAIRDVLATDDQPHTEDEVVAIFGDFKQRLVQTYRDLDVKEQPGAAALFESLHERGIKVVLNTGYDRATAESLVARLGWAVGNEIDGLVTASDVDNGRPAPDMIRLSMELTGVELPQEVAKVGDSQIDIEEGHNAGCGVSLGVTTGAQNATLLKQANPTGLIDRLSEVLHFVAAENEPSVR